MPVFQKERTMWCDIITEVESVVKTRWKESIKTMDELI